jgi:hypothetical protein
LLRHQLGNLDLLGCSQAVFTWHNAQLELARMRLIELGGMLLKGPQLHFFAAPIQRLCCIEDLWMFIAALPLVATIFSWPFGYWLNSRGEESMRRWLIDQSILLGVGLVFGASFLIANALS